MAIVAVEVDGLPNVPKAIFNGQRSIWAKWQLQIQQ